MGSKFTELIVDCANPERLADFWAAALGWQRTGQDEGIITIAGPPGAGPALVFVPVPEPKTVKNRMHLDVVGDRDALLAAGATVLRAKDDDIEWDVLADPEGNEFCVFAPAD